MEVMEKLRQFLLGFSGWDEEPSIDHGEDGPGQTGLFPGSQEVSHYRKDLAGNVQAEYLVRFILRRRLRPGQDGAQWLLDLDNWLQQQAASGQTAGLGDVSAYEKLWLQKGECKPIPRLGEGLCTVTLAAKFVKTFKRGGASQ